MKKGDIGIKAVTSCKEGYCLRYHRDTILRVGEVFKSDFGCSFCDKASETLKYFEYPFAMKYLELKILSEPENLGDGHSFSANEVEVLREIPIEELRRDIVFDAACIRNKAKQEEDQEWFKTQMREMKEDREEEIRVLKANLRFSKKLIVFEYLFILVVLIVIPFVLHYLGVF